MSRIQPILAPSILAADFTKLGEQLAACNRAGTSWIHCDIMDGHFVPNISFGPMIVEAANRATDAFLDVHLMVYNPDMYIEPLIKAGADQVTVHIEATPHIHRSIQNITQKGLKAGVAINPATSLSLLEPILPEVDLVILMSVNPGFGAQKFITSTYPRIQELCEMREKVSGRFLIEIDGGVGLDNAEMLVKTGADVLVAGNTVFSSKDIAATIAELEKRMG